MRIIVDGYVNSNKYMLIAPDVWVKLVFDFL